MNLKNLLNFENYLRLLDDIADGRVDVPEYGEWLEWFGGDKEKLKKVFREIARKLKDRNHDIIYPLETIVVPRYPFSKKPMIGWHELQDRDFKDSLVNEIKYYSSRLGKLINTAVIMKHFILIDIDKKIAELRKIADVETRRGYHIIRYIPDYEAIRINDAYSYTINVGSFNIEIKSGKGFLWSYPPQSRYLEYRNGVVNVRVYKILSKDLRYAIGSGDLSLIKARVDDIPEILRQVLEPLGLGEYVKRLSFKGVEKQESVQASVPKVNPKESRFNALPMMLVGFLDYEEFKKALAKHLKALPVCLREALFGFPQEGSRYFHLRLLLAVAPFFVVLNEKNLRALVEDYASRTAKRPSEVREWAYYAKYFTGKAVVNDETIHVASRLGVPEEAWSYFETSGYCDKCPLKPICLGKPSSLKRKAIVEYIVHLLGEEQ